MRLKIIIISIFLYSNYLVNAQVSKPDTIKASKTHDIITLDGILDESIWQRAQIVSNFTQRELNNGMPATEVTKAALVYDDNSLYLGVWCYDSEPDKIISKEMKRDFPYWTEDNFEIIIDPFNNDRDGYVFVVNPNGARADVMTAEDGRKFNINWNGIWDAETQITDDGWFAEFRIPFATLKFPNRPLQTWGINLERNIRRKQEQLFWQGWSRDYDFEWVSHAGTLIGIDSIKGNNNLEVKPFVTTGLALNKNQAANEQFSVGGDINYLPTPTLKLNLTVNTDFAQVESDRAVVNLTRFSIFFPELREFFLEGKDFFNSDIQSGSSILFYSRRIGIGPNREEIPIIAGGRLMGTVGRTNIGAMSIQTTAKGNVATANNSVVRVEHNFLEKSSVGLIATSRVDKSGYNYVLGSDFNFITSEFIKDKNLQLKAAFASSITNGIDDNKNISYKMSVSYPNDIIEFFAGAFGVQENFKPELGFLVRENYQSYSSAFRIKPRPTKYISWIQQIEFKPWDFEIYNTYGTGKLESFNNEFGIIDVSLTSGDGFEIIIHRNFEGPSRDFEITDGIIIPSGNYWNTNYEISFDSFRGRLFSFNASYYTGGFYDGSINQYATSLIWSIDKHINLSGDFRQNIGDVSAGKFSTDEIGGRIEYAFNPKLYTNLYTQYNTNDREVLINLRLNWIPVVGSDLYIAINQHIDVRTNRISLLDTTILAKFVWRFAML